MSIPSHLPQRLTISLWDFSWYTMTTPGEPFADLDRAFAELVERGYNTVRICALPYVLFGSGAPRAEPLHLSRVGSGIGFGTRWYNARGGAVLDGPAHLLALFRAAQRHGCFVILSSWEYQQSLAFLDKTLHNEMMGIPPAERCERLAQGMGALIQYLKDHDLAEQIAYAELHNEVDLRMTRVADMAGPDDDLLVALKPYLEAAIAQLQAQHNDILFTTSYVFPPIYQFRNLAQNIQVAHFHLYVPGVLGQLNQQLGLYDLSAPFPNALARAMLRPDAPPYETYVPASADAWRFAASTVDPQFFYMSDWIDVEKADRYLYEHYPEYRGAMRAEMQQRLAAYADFAAQHSIPAVIGEGYVGYTPLYSTFEEGPVGKDLCELAVETCLELDFWGMVLCSNAAPHHPFWQDVAWQRRLNARILGHTA